MRQANGGTTPSIVRSDDGKLTYSDSVARGYYDRYVGGFFGKYDNVRSYWEDQLTRFVLRPHAKGRVDHVRNEGRGLRVVDLGCGAGQGYEILTRIPSEDLSLSTTQDWVVDPADLGIYLGLDLSAAMIEKGRETYQSVDHVEFEVADLRKGLGMASALPPFDVYLSSYGALSHLDLAGMRSLLGAIAEHASDGAIVVLDLVGRYSMEWPDAWSAASEAEKVRDYSMSYLYVGEDRPPAQVEHFPLRFWTGEDVRETCEEVGQRHGVKLSIVEILDRSLMVGRHVDTGAYGTCLPPLRSVINSLHEDYVRTDLQRLIAHYKAVDGHPELNHFFETLVRCWNSVVRFTMRRLAGERIDLIRMGGWKDYPSSLQMALMNMDRVVDSVAWMPVGDARANIIEPQLSYSLRALEYNMQRGLGCGHGLVGVLRVEKAEGPSDWSSTGYST